MWSSCSGSAYSKAMTQFVHCPNCRTRVAWSADNPYRPFCSERCKMVDLGAWMNEDNRIPGIELPDELLEELREESDDAGDRGGA